MGEVKGFLKHKREEYKKVPPAERRKNWNEFVTLPAGEDLQKQGARCMDCGVPFCQWGCPVGNIIPAWNDLVCKGQWKDAWERLRKTNNFPEFTGRVCPAPCENSCTLTINNPAVTIKNIELAVVEKAYEEKWICPAPPMRRNDLKVAVIGSGPAGLACADQLNKKGYKVTVFEKNEFVGGLLTLGIPNFKLNKAIVKRRVHCMEQEGVLFQTGVNVGVDVALDDVKKKADAVIFCGGAEQPRDVLIPGRDLKGIFFAMEYLSQQTRRLMGVKIEARDVIDAKGKRVIVLGGGDTGSDCVGTANRQGALWVKQFELMPRPPADRAVENPWPQWALIQRTSTSHEEGCERDYGILTKSFSGRDGAVESLRAVRLDWSKKSADGRAIMQEIVGSEFDVECDMVFLALGFLGPVKAGLLEASGVELDQRGNVKVNKNKMTSVPGLFAAGDMARGQSLVVWAIQEGRVAAEGVHEYLMERMAKKPVIKKGVA